MGPPRSRSREAALPASRRAPRLRRCGSFACPPGASRYECLQRSRNRLSRLEISSCRLRPQILATRPRPATPRLLLRALRRGFPRDAARARKADRIGPAKFLKASPVHGVCCPPWPSNSLEQPLHCLFAALRSEVYSLCSTPAGNLRGVLLSLE